MVNGETKLSADARSDAAVLAEWSRDPSRFRTPPLWEVSHILIACNPRDVEVKWSQFFGRLVLCNKTKYGPFLKFNERCRNHAGLTANQSVVGSIPTAGAKISSFLLMCPACLWVERRGAP